jgi:flagellar basal-body rod modification protein FlgD
VKTIPEDETKREGEMATSITGIMNQLGLEHPEDSKRMVHSNATSGSDTGSSASTSANISANDFLTLLVTEMQNQDPTANTDPNEYINQLVQVNSLEQLISINQTLTTDSSPTKGTTSGGSGTKKDAAAVPPATATAASPLTLPTPAQANSVSGNLAVPATNPAALRVAQTFGSTINRQ